MGGDLSEILMIDCIQISRNCMHLGEIFQPYQGENRLHFSKMKMMSALYNTDTLSWICIVLYH